MTARQLREYQRHAVERAFETPSIALHIEQGLGKTAATGHLIDRCLHDSYDVGRWLIVGPKMVAKDVWTREFGRWDTLRHLLPMTRVLTFADLSLQRVGRELDFRDKRATKKHLLGLQERVHVASFDALPWLVHAYGANWPYEGLVIDEAEFVKHASSLRHKAVWHVAQARGYVKRQVQLTGTPAPQGRVDLYGQIRLLDGGARLGRTQHEFQSRWCVPDKRSRERIFSWKVPESQWAAMDRALADVVVSMRSKDWLELPELVVNDLEVELPERAQEFYDELERELVAQIGDSQVLAPSAAALRVKLLQVCNGAVYAPGGAVEPVHDAKLERLGELVEGASGPVLLAYAFQHDWDRIRAFLGKRVRNVKEHGALDAFRRGGVRVLAMHPASGGHGLDGLQDVASEVVWFGGGYTTSQWLQLNARLHRSGQRAGRVVVHRLMARGTVEGAVAANVAANMDEQSAFIEALRAKIRSE